MPLVDVNQAATWAASYRVVMDDGSVVGYDRRAKDRILGQDHWALLKALGIVKGQRVVLLGSGFGWVGEDWTAAGYGPIVCCDTSTWIQANKAQHATVAILNEGASTTASRRNIKVALGGQNVVVDWAITEDILPWLTDAECTALAAAVRQLATNVAHWITPGYGVGGAGSPAQDTGLNWKSMASWKALVAPDKVVRRGGAEVL